MSITSSQLPTGLGPSLNRTPYEDFAAGKKLFVGGLSVKVGEILLREYFQRFGELERLVIVREQGISKGYGFVTFKDARAARWVTQERHFLGDKSFSCTYLLSDKQAKKQALADKKRKLFLKNLSFNTKELTIKLYFEMFGAVERVTINRNLDGSSKGSGFVLFEASYAARSALKHKLPHIIDGRSLKVYATLTKQEIKEYSAKLEQAQDPSLFTRSIEKANSVHSNHEKWATKIASCGQGTPNNDSGECRTACQVKQKRTTNAEWQSVIETRLFGGVDPKGPAKADAGFFSTATRDIATVASTKCAQLATSDEMLWDAGAHDNIPSTCLSISARGVLFKAHAEDSENLVFRFSNYRFPKFPSTKVPDLVSSHCRLVSKNPRC